MDAAHDDVGPVDHCDGRAPVFAAVSLADPPTAHGGGLVAPRWA